MDVPAIAKVKYDTLYKFLASHNASWDVDIPHDDSGKFLYPVDAKTVIEKLEQQSIMADDMDYLYVFNYEDEIWEAVMEMADKEIPILHNPDELNAYLVLSRHKGHDYLHLSPSLVQASNGEYINLMQFNIEDMYQDDDE